MPKNYYEVILSDEEKTKLKKIIHSGVNSSARTIMHANILLNTDDGLAERRNDNREIAKLFYISPTTVNQVRKLYATQGVDGALNRKTYLSDSAFSKITGEFEAQVLAAALSPAPAGRSKWTLRLLAKHCAEKKYIVSISHSAIGEMLNPNAQ